MWIRIGKAVSRLGEALLQQQEFLLLEFQFQQQARLLRRLQLQLVLLLPPHSLSQALLPSRLVSWLVSAPPLSPGPCCQGPLLQWTQRTATVGHQLRTPAPTSPSQLSSPPSQSWPSPPPVGSARAASPS